MHRYSRPRIARASSVFFATLAVALSGVGLFVFGQSDAAAAINPAIQVNITELVKSHDDGSEHPGETINVHDHFKMKFTWDATNANPQPGDEFAIELPSHFYNREFPLTRDLNFEGNKVGQCTIEERLFKCTLGEGIRGKTSIRGEGTATMRASHSTTTNTSTFKINGNAVSVPNPGNGPVGEVPQKPWNPVDPYKWGDAPGELSEEITWSIGFGGEKLAPLYGNQIPTTLVLDDVIGAGHRLKMDPSLIRLTMTGRSDSPNMDWADLARADKSSEGVHTEWGNFSLDVESSDNDSRVRFTVKGPFSADHNYVVRYRTVPDTANGKVQPGFTYENTVTFVGGDKVVSHETSYTDSFTISITMEDGFGSFKVSKALAGNGANQLDPATKLNVKAAWVLPDNKQPSDFPQWQAPANPAILEVQPGKTAQFNGTFPVGTRITLSEDLASTNPALPAGVRWSNPKFEIAGVDNAAQPSEITFEVANKQSTAVKLTNTAEKLPTGGFRVSKTVVDAANRVPDDKGFTFDYTCTLGGKEVKKGVLGPIQHGQTADSPTDIPAGAACQITEQDASLPNMVLQVTGDTVVQIAGGAPQSTTITNTYTPAVGSFTLKKVVVDGDNVVDDAKTFSFTYVCKIGDTVVKEGNVGPLAHDATAKVEAVPAGAACTITEADATIPNVTLETTGLTDPVLIQADTNSDVTATNTYTQDLGAFTVKKVVVDGDNVVDDAKTFSFSYVCKVGDTVVKEGNVGPLAHDATAKVEAVPAGAACTITEADAQVEHTSLVTTGLEQPIAITKGGNAEVTVTNTYTRHFGSFQVKKAVAGDNAEAFAKDSFAIDYVCGELTGTLEVPGDGQTVVRGPQVPAGTTCTLKEKADTAAREGYNVTTTADVTEVNIVNETIKDVVFTNTYARQLGTFQVAKRVGGVDKFAKDKFRFTYTCGDETGTLEVPGDGTPVPLGKSLPTGTKCIISEDTAAAQRDGYTLTIVGDQAEVLVKEGDNGVTTITNQYVEKPKPTPTPTPTPPPSIPSKPGKPQLPKTGADAITLGVVAAGTMAAGALLIARRRRA
ncbi:LPXTG cell wall anchor domain-containing protein [Buchananella hordeovulneris]|uniref:DUF5979 domain-containing protein n=1 Tax=Buchananella hordeovulneris TaxID=52770 RepID=UPI000F5E3027|nr:DUF5979 domain-containing protein [Buchananella hordeovulneris]RRD51956.1 LPXTG cell wall anchor domain-containing protein [Buchananella hordeovulneris]